MSVTIPGVPESITRDRFLEMIRLLGLDPYRLTHLEFSLSGIVATVKAQGPDGKALLDPFHPNEVAKHYLFIPITD